ncbi:MAG: metal ABC transporter ATP-binding protein [Thermoanaerobaculia bacterium]|nr:metal ABC transporter ATP-binding protein [Thermoanaerobaculia bacterium]
MADEIRIRVDGVTVGYGRDTVLEDASLIVRDGDFLGIIGPNGGGKTTLIKAMLGLLEPWRGTVERRKLERPGAMGYVPQLGPLEQQPPLRVEELVALGRPRYLSRRESREVTRDAVRTTLERVGLQERSGTLVADLSGGQWQRTLVARALVAEPEILFLDEPMAAVDAEFRRVLVELLQELNRRIPVVVVTHDLTPFAQVVRQIACVNRAVHYHPEGKLTPESLEEVYGCPVELISHGVPHRVLPPHGEGP